MEIRDKGYYRDVLGFETFEAYCKAKWDITRRRAYQYIDVVNTIDNVNHGTQNTPVNERQVRPLAHLAPNQQREAWQKAVETAPGGKVTAAHVYKIVSALEAKETAAGWLVRAGHKSVGGCI